MRAIVFLVALVLSPIGAFAQSAISQAGPPAAGHAPMYLNSSGGQVFVQDSGPARGGQAGVGLSELLLAARGTGTPPYSGQGTGPYGTNFCDYDAPITNPTGYHFLCMSPNAGGAALIAMGSVGSAPPLPLKFNINGSLYQFPYTIGGIVGPSTTVSGDFACWNNTVGSLLKDCGTPSVLATLAPGTGVATALGQSVNKLTIPYGMLTGALIGTSGATIPLNNTANSESGAWTFTGGANIGGGTPLTFTYNLPILTGTPLAIPLAVDTIGAPAMAIERSTTYSGGATTSPSLYVGTLASISAPTAWVEGFDSHLEVTAYSGTGGGFAEASRGDCIINASVTDAKCTGGVFIAPAFSTTGVNQLVGVEAMATNYYLDAPSPNIINLDEISASFVASSGFGLDTGKIIDAAFLVNGYSSDGFQAGFECPVEGTPGTTVRNGCFVDYSHAYYGLLLNGTYGGPAIYANGPVQIVPVAISALLSCALGTLGSTAIVNNGTAFGTGTYGSAVSATGAVTRKVICTNTGGSSTYAWAYD